MRKRTCCLAVAATLLALTGCVEASDGGPVDPSGAPTTGAPTIGAPPTLPAPSPQPLATPSEQRRQTIAVRIERRVSDAATEDFQPTVVSVLTDPRGWARAGFDFVENEDAVYRIVLAEGREVDRLCAPYRTRSKYSCQNGPTVALNATRWRRATPSWLGSLAEYRTMLINHEVGHLLHLHHPQPQCPRAGLPAPVMTQQSTTLEGCRANPWPLRWEIALAAERREPLAPPADHDPSDHRPTPPPAHR